MPILVRPVREQLEHDRVIRLLQAKWRKQYDVEANVGDERRASVKVGQMIVFPDLVMTSQSSPKRLQALAEVETGESVNHLEAMAQWAHMSKAKAPFKLYVPVGAIDQARRLCGNHHVALFELWSYYVLGEQVRFTLIQRDRSLGGASGAGRSRGLDHADYGMEPLETETLGPLELPPPPPVAPPPPAAEVSKPAAERPPATAARPSSAARVPMRAGKSKITVTTTKASPPPGAARPAPKVTGAGGAPGATKPPTATKPSGGSRPPGHGKATAAVKSGGPSRSGAANSVRAKAVEKPSSRKPTPPAAKRAASPARSTKVAARGRKATGRR